MKDGVVLRYRMIRCKTLCFGGTGGLQTVYSSVPRRKEAELAVLRELEREYPRLVSVNEVRRRKQENGGADQRTLPLVLVSQGAPTLRGKQQCMWRYSANEVDESKKPKISKRGNGVVHELSDNGSDDDDDAVVELSDNSSDDDDDVHELSDGE